jgi:hypothetical protein
MKDAKQLAAYVLIVAVVAVAFLQTGRWLIASDPNYKAEPRVATIPPRIADSIERKKDLVPVSATPVSAPATATVAAAPMREAAVSLAQPPRQVIHELSLPKPAAPKRKPKARTIEARVAPSWTEPARSQAVTTARSDVPY